MFQYIYQNSDIFDKLVNHIYQPAICEVVQRLLNFSKSVFMDDLNSSQTTRVQDEEADEIRANVVFSIIEKLGPDFGFEYKLGALSILRELPNKKVLNDLMTSSRSMQTIQDFLQTEDEDVKSSTFQFLIMLLNRFFPEREAKDEIRGRNMYLMDPLKS